MDKKILKLQTFEETWLTKLNNTLSLIEMETCVLDTHNSDILISISTVCTLMINLFVSVNPSGCIYTAGYRIKIKLICRLVKDRDQALI